ncbi:MAG: putative lipid II flippase FtsW [Candidatus Hydrogenedentota bacterium]
MVKDEEVKPIRKRAKNLPDIMFFSAAITLSVIGFISVSSASAAEGYRLFHNVFYFTIRHIIFLITGILALIIFTYFNYRALKKISLPMLILSTILLGIVLIPQFGSLAGGARRWFRIGPLSFQPSEFARFAIIIYLGVKLSLSQNNVRDSLENFLKVWLLPLVLCVLIILEPHFSMSILLIITVGIFIFICGAKMLHLISVGLMFIPVAIGLIIKYPYRARRILAYLDPFTDPSDKGYHIIQSLKAIIKGGFFGVGLGEGTQKLGYLPEPHTDFILAIIAEELGFIVVAVILLLFFIIAWRGFKIASQSSNKKGSLLASGLTLFLVIPAMINVAVITGLIPSTGIPLTYISYGGTSLLFAFIATGIILNISRQL